MRSGRQPPPPPPRDGSAGKCTRSRRATRDGGFPTTGTAGGSTQLAAATPLPDRPQGCPSETTRGSGPDPTDARGALQGGAPPLSGTAPPPATRAGSKGRGGGRGGPPAGTAPTAARPPSTTGRRPRPPGAPSRAPKFHRPRGCPSRWRRRRRCRRGGGGGGTRTPAADQQRRAPARPPLARPCPCGSRRARVAPRVDAAAAVPRPFRPFSTAAAARVAAASAAAGGAPTSTLAGGRGGPLGGGAGGGGQALDSRGAPAHPLLPCPPSSLSAIPVVAHRRRLDAAVSMQRGGCRPWWMAPWLWWPGPRRRRPYRHHRLRCPPLWPPRLQALCRRRHRLPARKATPAVREWPSRSVGGRHAISPIPFLTHPARFPRGYATPRA